MTDQAPPRASLAAILAPRSVAVIGASEDTSKFGGRILHHLIKHGYPGRIVPVNPRRSHLFGLPAVPSITEAGPVDVATIAVPPDQVVTTVAACAAAGVAAAVIITAQMGEIGGEGAVREREIVRIARASGMRLIGPNCLGIVNAPLRMALTASFAMGVDRLPPGGVAIVSQSGALMATMFNAGHDIGAGFSKLVSIGNQADVTETDVFEALIDDPETRAITFYTEGLSDAGRFFAQARRARAAGKAVVAVKAGRTEAGRAAAFSHTASLSGPYRLFQTVARDHGVVLTDDTEAAVAIAEALIRWPQGLAEGQGVALVSGSGGGGGILADRLDAAGLPILAPSEATRAALEGFLPPGHSLVPLDAGALRQGLGIAVLREVLLHLAHDPATGALVYLMTTQPMMSEIADLLDGIAAETGKPVLLVLSAGTVADDLRARLRTRGRLFVDRIDDAIRVLSGLRDHARPPRAMPPAASGAGLAPLAATLPRGALPPAEAETLLRAAGLPLVESAVVTTEAEAQAAAARIGWPVVLKAVGPGIVHKSDLGGVVLDLRDGAALAGAFAALRARFGTALSGRLVQRQAEGVAELILGTLHDAELGSFVVVGAGGIHAEILSDTAIARAPLDLATARGLIGQLRVAPLLAGARGRPRADTESAARALVALGDLAAALGPELAELDINPLIVGREGEGSLAADVRLRLTNPRTDR